MFNALNFAKLLLFLCNVLLSIRHATSFISNTRVAINRRFCASLVFAENGVDSKRKRGGDEIIGETDDTTLQKTDDPTLQKTLDPSGLEQPTLIETIGGGSATIFEMARRMLVWDQPNGGSKNGNSKEAKDGVLPRWHPHSGISDVNPSFRTKAPVMNNQGYAGTIWRNVRKRNKPSLWRHALRTYDQMEGAGESTSGVLRIERSTVHHEGALLACAKLGLWKKSLDVFQAVESVTDNMLLSVVKACVRASKRLRREETTLEERRAPLDAAVKIIEDTQSKQDFPLVARHLNPLSAAYQSLGLVEESKEIIKKYLTDRSRGPEPEYGSESFNVHDVSAKDKASYALLVQGAVSSGNWAEAIEALENMTEAGLYPNSRNLNSWTEVSERKTKHRRTRSWKKKRDEYWLESVS